LDGYENIDFPSSFHSVQEKSVADIYADITTLRYPAESVDEVRLHHVFEHFPRPVACGLLACWYSWLRPGGVLHIEVPDFSRTARIMLNPFCSFKRRAVAERHLYGSHEAPWAVHCEGYAPWMLKKMLSVFGFDVVRTTGNEWCGTCNVEIIASRVAGHVTKEMFVRRADEYLQNYLLDTSDLEMRIHAVWMVSFGEQLEKGWAQR
jgi:hypothetical protein